MKNEKGFITIVALALVIVVVGGAGYFLVTKKEAPVANNNQSIKDENTTSPVNNFENKPADSDTEVIETVVAPVATSAPIIKPLPTPIPTSSVISTPREIYIKLRTEFDAAKNFDEALAVTIKYSTSKDAAMYTEQARLTSDEVKLQMYPSLKAMIPLLSTIKIVGENISGNIATLSVTSGSKVGVVTLEKEGGVWKMKSESWK
jgi:hypothetical protein